MQIKACESVVMVIWIIIMGLKWKLLFTVVSWICRSLLEAVSTPKLMCFLRIPNDPQLEVWLGQFFFPQE